MSLVTVNEYDIAPSLISGASTLSFDLSELRLLDSNGNQVENSMAIPGNSIPVTVGLAHQVFMGTISGSGTRHCDDPKGDTLTVVYGVI